MAATEEAKTDHRAMNIYQKLAAITGEIGVIKKDGTNRDQGYAFIEYAAVSGKLRTLFSDYGVVIVPRMQRAAKQHRAEVTSSRGAKGVHALIDFYFDVVNADKPEDHFVVQWTGEAMGYDDKITNKAATSALKYYLMRQFNISEKGDDPDAETPESVESSRPAPRATVASTNRDPSEKQIGLIKTLAKRKGKDDTWTEGALGKIKSSADASAVIDKLQELEDA